MTLTEFKQRIEAHSPGSQISREWILEQLGEMPEAGYDTIAWVAIKEAAAITGFSEDKLRSKAPYWTSVEKPEVRARRMNPQKLRSPWLFSEDDCMAYRTKHSGGPRPVPDVQDPDDIDALKAHYREKVTANL